MRVISGIFFAVVSLMLISLGDSDISAEDRFSVDGQIRLRNEYDLKSTDSLRHSMTFHDLRTRVGLKFEPTKQALVYVQFQDSRRLGDPSSGDLTATDNVDLHQAYFEIRDVVFRRLWIMAGRFELNYGNQRVFGSVGWHNIGRSWEGGLMSYRGGQCRIDLFNLRKRELNDEEYNRDFDIFGLYSMIESLHLDLFAFYEIDADTNGHRTEKLKRGNIGAYYSGDLGDFDITAQGAYQFGDMPGDTFLPDGIPRVQLIRAFMLAAEAGYNFEGRGKARTAVGIDYTSGDDGNDPRTHYAYYNAYFTRHKFRGYMDLFSDSAPYGLIDIMLRGEISPAKRWRARADIHYFKAAADYISNADDSTLTDEIGIECDLTVVNKSISGATLTGGMSFFVADKHFSPAGDGRKTGLWAYLMTSVDF